MPAFSDRGLHITIPVPYGLPNQTTFWVRTSTGTEMNYTDKVVYHDVVKRINNLWYAEVTFTDVDTAERAVIKVGSTCKIFTNNKIQFRGRMDIVEWDSYNNARVTIYGMAILLKDNMIDEDYVATTTDDIVDDLADGTGLTVGSNTTSWTVDINFANINRLSAIGTLANLRGWYWYESYGSYPYNTPYINYASTIGSATSTYTFNATGVSQNIYVTNHITNSEEQVNYVVFKGDAITSDCFHATTTRTTLNMDLAVSGTTIALISGTGFSSGMQVWIGCEKCGLGSPTSTTIFSNSVRGLEYLAGLTGEYAHQVGTPVYDAQYTTTSPQASSSIDTYGVLKKGFADKTITNQSTLDIRASTVLASNKDPLNIITVEVAEKMEVLELVSLGDLVTIEDATTELTGTYQVVGILFGFDDERGDYCELEIYNIAKNFVDKVMDYIEQKTL